MAVISNAQEFPLFEKIQSLPGPSGAQEAQACGLTKSIPVPEGFVVPD